LQIALGIHAYGNLKEEKFREFEQQVPIEKVSEVTPTIFLYLHNVFFWMTLAHGKMFLGDRYVPQAPIFRLLIDSLQKITKASSTLNFTFQTGELQICLINLIELTHKKVNHQLSKDDFCDLYSLLTLNGQPQPILPPNSHIKTQS
jgi:hypothetical protein